MARVVPSGRDLRKYARLFLRTDQDSDGYISAEEARDVFSKSYLPPDVLIHIFNQANVSQSPHLSFPEFVAAMHLIREARHTQQPVSISAELMNFLSNFYESPWDLATQGSSKSAQAMKQSAHSTYQAQADLSLGQEMNSVQPVPPTPDFPSAENFGETTKPLEEFPAEGFADTNFGFGPETEKDEKGKRKKDKKEKKKKAEKVETKDEMSFGAEATFGHDSSLDPKPVKESWPSFGNEEEMTFGLQDKERQKKVKKKDTQKESTNDLSWPDVQTESASPVPHFGSTDRPGRDMTGTGMAGMAGVGTVPQPRTRLGLPVESHTFQTDGDRDPDYVARLEEILGVSKQVRHQEAALRARLDKENSRWAGRRNDGHFEERYRTAFTDLGEYRSPGVYVSLMGLKHNSHTPRVLPESAKPFLKSLTPNFQAPGTRVPGVPGPGMGVQAWSRVAFA